MTVLMQNYFTIVGVINPAIAKANTILARAIVRIVIGPLDRKSVV